MGDPLAVEHVQSALAIRESVLGADHKDSIATVDLLKRLLRALDEDAKPLKMDIEGHSSTLFQVC
jgi:hypothetical protein